MSLQKIRTPNGALTESSHQRLLICSLLDSKRRVNRSRAIIPTCVVLEGNHKEYGRPRTLPSETLMTEICFEVKRVEAAQRAVLQDGYTEIFNFTRC